ncbi:MAG: hypothetical protein KKB30_09120 [Proteobacteria bacterium]|nr:hypothetical protein [Pseudomonadota bacterium]MBU1714083.1 hypothetical protein [Pseudomonadota bacterium]
MGFVFEQECPQCGAPIVLDETDRILCCSYCNTNNYLSSDESFRFILPGKELEGESVYVPYLRFKGCAYSCLLNGIQHRIIDITHLATPCNILPPSLGLRPQAMKMKFADPNTPGTFLKSFLKTDDILNKAAKFSISANETNTFHQTLIGETISRIYLPLSIKEDSVFDAITGDPLAKIPSGQEIFESAHDQNNQWRPNFLPTICPQCGWNLSGEKDSIILVCKNCDTAWKNRDHQFVPVKFKILPTRREDSLFLPFWQITAGTTNGEINSVADFLRFTNQPRVAQQKQTEQKMNFWVPAFKVKPQIFLRLASQLTIAQPEISEGNSIPKQEIHPATLPESEAVQCLKLILANTTTQKKKMWPLLPEINFSVTDLTLVYIPFSSSGYGLYQEEMRININKQVLKFGRHL